MHGYRSFKIKVPIFFSRRTLFHGVSESVKLPRMDFHSMIRMDFHSMMPEKTADFSKSFKLHIKVHHMKMILGSVCHISIQYLVILVKQHSI